MKNLIYTCLMVLILSSIGYSQPREPLICLNNFDFSFPEVMRRSGKNGSILAQFDVKNLTPVNIVVNTVNGSLDGGYIFSTEKNLNKITFLKDTTGVELLFNYIVKPHRVLNSDYAILKNENEIEIVARRIVQKIVDMPYEITDTAITFYDILRIEYISKKEADILIRLLFSENSIEYEIIHNNFPELNAQIANDIQSYLNVRDQKYYNPNLKYYVKYQVVPHYPECGIDYGDYY